MNFLCLRLQNLQSRVRCLQSLQQIQQIRDFNANRSSICNISRQKYCRMFRVLMVYPDGSTVTVRHSEPQSIIQLPVLLDDCQTDAERREWLSRRKRVEKIEIEEDVELDYNPKQYLHLFKSKSRA